MECVICHKTISGSHLIDKWGKAICQSHYPSEVTFCASCEQFTLKNVRTPDGRYFCNKCQSSLISSNASIDFAKDKVIQLLNRQGFYDLRQEDIQIIISTANEIAQYRNQPTNLLVKGLTLSSKIWPSGTSKHIIYILTHQSRIEFAGTLAHEMLHAWLVQNDIYMDNMRTEGFCNLGSWLMLQTIHHPLARHLEKQLFENPDPIYGDGFRMMYKAFQKRGIIDLCKYISIKYKKQN